MKKFLNILIKAILAAVFIVTKLLLAGKAIPQWLQNTVGVGAMLFSVLTVSAIVTLILSVCKPASKRAQTSITVFISLWRYFIAILILCWGLTICGVNVNTIVASVGIIALVIGFSAESLIADLITGIFMIFENQYNVGDIIEIDGFRGKVVSIGIRTTCIEDGSQNVKIINNSEMKNLVNKSNNTSKAICDFCIPYETDLEDLEKKIPQILQDIYKDNGELFQAEPTYLGVQELGDSSVILRFIAEVSEKDIFTGGRALNRELFIRMKKIGIECPYQQVVIHDAK